MTQNTKRQKENDFKRKRNKKMKETANDKKTKRKEPSLTIALIPLVVMLLLFAIGYGINAERALYTL